MREKEEDGKGFGKHNEQNHMRDQGRVDNLMFEAAGSERMEVLLTKRGFQKKKLTSG